MSFFVLLLALAQATQPLAEEAQGAPAQVKPSVPEETGAASSGKPAKTQAADAKAPAAPADIEVPAPARLEPLVGQEQPPISPDGRVNRTRSEQRNDLSRLQRQLETDPESIQGQAAVDATNNLAKKLKLSQPLSDEPVVREAQESPLPSRPEPEQVRYFARAWFQALIAGDARLATSMSAVPFQFEERTVRTPDDLKAEWLKALRSRRADLVELYDLEVLTPTEMEKKYGKPPARLSGLHWRDPKTYVVVANLSGHAAVVVFRAVPAGFGWQAIGYHD